LPSPDLFCSTPDWMLLRQPARQARRCVVTFVLA
jgi:hypothetical protein